MPDAAFDLTGRRAVVTGASAGIGAAVAAYGATKAGLAAVTVALAKERRSDGIRVTQVAPGIVDTPMAADVIRELTAAGASVNIAGRAGRPDEIAALVHYLVAPAGRFATGICRRMVDCCGRCGA